MKRRVLFTMKELKELMDRLKAEQQEEERDFATPEEKDERRRREEFEDYSEDERQA